MRHGEYLVGVPVASKSELRLWASDCPKTMDKELHRRDAVAFVVHGALHSINTKEYASLGPAQASDTDEAIDNVATAISSLVTDKVESFFVDNNDQTEARIQYASRAFTLLSDTSGTNNPIKTHARKIIQYGSQSSVSKFNKLVIEKSKKEIGESLKEAVYELGALTVVAASLGTEHPTQTVRESSGITTELALINKTTDEKLQKILSGNESAKPPYFKLRYRPELFQLINGKLYTLDLHSIFSDGQYWSPTPGCPALKGGSITPFRNAVLNAFSKVGLNELAKQEAYQKVL